MSVGNNNANFQLDGTTARIHRVYYLKGLVDPADVTGVIWGNAELTPQLGDLVRAPGIG